MTRFDSLDIFPIPIPDNDGPVDSIVHVSGLSTAISSSAECATFSMATAGILMGRLIGEKFGRIAEAIGGLGLIVIGAKILLEHTLIS